MIAELFYYKEYSAIAVMYVTRLTSSQHSSNLFYILPLGSFHLSYKNTIYHKSSHVNRVINR